MNLKDKVIVITGASKGLGKALAAGLVKVEAKVVISARSAKELKVASKETGAVSFVADVTKEGDMKKLAAFAVKKFGRLDVWVNNAGTTLPHSSIEDINITKAHGVMEVNFFGTLYGTRAALRVMKKQKIGTIMNIISKGSLVGRPNSALYGATKWAARGFTESLRLAVEGKNISVIAVHPGGIKTTIFGKFIPAGYEGWMETDYVARRIIQNLKLSKPKEELIIGQK